MEAFKYGCVVSGGNFCPRPQLSQQLSAYIATGQNVVIQGERRMGKMSLAHETVAGMRGWRTLTADFMGVKSVSDVCVRLADSPFVFLGSARNEMMLIFMSPRSPFYKSAISFSVDAIPDDDFYEFAKSRFALGKRRLSRESFALILDKTSRTTGDMQELCDAIYQISDKGDLIDAGMIGRGLQLAFNRERSAYATFVKTLTDIQMRVLKTLARHGSEHVLSGEFLSCSCVANPTSLKRALTALEKSDLVYSIGGEWKFVSPFFRAWLPI